jgi:hypothetical protein
MWAHEKCTAGVSWGYICPNCKSDVSDEDFWSFVDLYFCIEFHFTL